MTRLFLGTLLGCSFLSAQGHVLRVRLDESQRQLTASRHHVHHESPPPRPDQLGGSTTRAVWQGLDIRWQEPSRCLRLPPSTAAAAGRIGSPGTRDFDDRRDVPPVLRV